MASDDLSAKTQKMRAKLREARIRPTHGAVLPTDEYIGEVERTICTQMPEDYRWFLREFGASIPEIPQAYRLDPACPWGGGEALAGFDFLLGPESRCTDLLEMCIEYCGDRIPREFIPIGLDGVDNILCLGVRSPYRGQVYLWIFEEETRPPTMDNMWFVANSFADFVEGLLPDPGYAPKTAA